MLKGAPQDDPEGVADDHDGAVKTSSRVPRLEEKELHSQPVVSEESQKIWLAFAKRALSRLVKRAKEAGVRDERAFVEPEAMFVWSTMKLANPDAPPDIDGTVPFYSSSSALEEQLASAYSAMLALVGADDEQTAKELAHMRKALPYVLASRGRSVPSVGDNTGSLAAALFPPEDSSTDSSTVPSSSLNGFKLGFTSRLAQALGCRAWPDGHPPTHPNYPSNPSHPSDAALFRWSWLDSRSTTWNQDLRSVVHATFCAMPGTPEQVRFALDEMDDVLATGQEGKDTLRERANQHLLNGEAAANTKCAPAIVLRLHARWHLPTT